METKYDCLTQKCGYCKKTFLQTSEFFKENKTGYLKTCLTCMPKSNKKCIHGKRKSRCVECKCCEICEHQKDKKYCVICGGKGLCEHQKRKSLCKICFPQNFCIHGSQKQHCVKCGGSNICKHGKRKSRCVLCDGSGICKHQKQKVYCVICGGQGLCEHGKRKSQCFLCGGSELCEHNKMKHLCKLCSDPIHITIQRMIYGSERQDQVCNRFDKENFIDYDHVFQLIQDSENNCYYCDTNLQFIDCRAPNGATIERLDNTIGHIKTNCVIACWKCNSSRIGGSQKKRKVK